MVRILHLVSARLACAGLAIILAGPACAEERPRAGVIVEYSGDGGRPAIVLAHDWFGASPFYADFAARLAEEGFTVIASDLYEGKPGATTHAGAWNLLKGLTGEHAAAVLDANIAAAADGSDTVIVIGFSAGAPHAFSAAIRNAEEVDATVIFYGDVIDDPDQLSRLGGPVLAIFGSKDPLYDGKAAADVAAEFSKAADAVGAVAEIHIYGGADHAFAQPLFNAGATYDAVAAESAWTVARDFISRVEESD